MRILLIQFFYDLLAAHTFYSFTISPWRTASRCDSPVRRSDAELSQNFLVGYIYIVENYTVTTVYVEGNLHYTNEEIMEMVMDGRYGNNSIFLSLKYRDKGVDNIPFIQTMDVSVEARDTIRIKVYEKAVAGYVAYLGRYIYFDKDGIVVETAEEKTLGIPQQPHFFDFHSDFILYR